MELAGLALSHGLARPLWMNTSQMKRLVRVDVAYPRYPALVQQPRPDG